MKYKDYTPTIQEIGAGEGGVALESDESIERMDEWVDLLEDMYHHTQDPEGLFYEAFCAWLQYSHCAIYETDNESGDEVEIYENYIKKAFTDGYMVGYALRLAGKTYKES